MQLSNFLCFSIYSAGHSLNRVYANLLGDLGLTYPQYLVMVLLWEKDDQTVGELGGSLHLESNTLTPMLKRLEAAGLVSRTRDRLDERQVRVGCTAAGAAMRSKACEIPARLLEATGITTEQAKRLQRQLSSMQTKLDEFSPAVLG